MNFILQLKGSLATRSLRISELNEQGQKQHIVKLGSVGLVLSLVIG